VGPAFASVKSFFMMLTKKLLKKHMKGEKNLPRCGRIFSFIMKKRGGLTPEGKKGKRKGTRGAEYAAGGGRRKPLLAGRKKERGWANHRGESKAVLAAKKATVEKPWLLPERGRKRKWDSHHQKRGRGRGRAQNSRGERKGGTVKGN